MTRGPDAIANSIRMKRSHYTGCFLIVEGRDDRLFFERFVNRSYCAVQVAGGKSNVIDVIEILDADDNFSGFVGVIDADLDHVEDHSWQSSNLIIIEMYDLEALLIKSTALDSVLIEFGSSEKIAKRTKRPREELIDATLPIGYLRLHSRRSKLNLKFNGVRYERFIDRDSLQTNVRNMVREVKNRSQRSDLACDDTAREIRRIEDTVNDPWLVCCGTDMVEILSIGLRRALGTNNSGAVTPDELRRCLRLAYQWQELTDSQLGRDLREWSERNPGFRVLKETHEP